MRGVKVDGCLHLKSACCSLGDGKILVNRAWIDTSQFGGYQVTGVAPDEPNAANVLRIGDTVIVPASFPQTAAIIEREGLAVRRIDISELQKAEAGVTCSSIIFG